jgi:hypothetical protein
MYEKVSWEEFKNSFRWKQGEHVTATAPTGAGKTTLFSELMPYRGYNIMFGTKKQDDTYTRIIRQNGFKRIQSIEEIKPWDKNVLLWPTHSKDMGDTKATQRYEFRKAMNMVMNQGSWTVWADEAKYMAEMLSLSKELTFMMEQLRSINATIICGAQRPAWLPRSVLSNSTHVFLWKATDMEDAKRLADIGGIDKKAVLEGMKTLGKHEFLYIRTRGTEAKIVRSQVERSRK